MSRFSVAFLTLTVPLLLSPALAQPAAPRRQNLALHRSYTMDPRPNYSLCKDAGDVTQLTDGVYTRGYFWAQRSTVGWGGGSTPFIVIDLGRDCPIEGVSLNTAGGVAQVHLPAAIYLFVSPDGKQWYPGGDLVKLQAAHGPLPAYGKYTVQRLWTDQLKTHGRYVGFYMQPGEGGYSFVDEIEVYQGPAEFSHLPYSTRPVADVKKYMQNQVIQDLIRAQFNRDLTAVKKDLAATPVSARADLAKQAAALAAAITNMPPVSMAGFRAVLPMTGLERNIFKLQAAVWRAQGKPILRVWTKNRWDMLAPAEEPVDNSAPVVGVQMMDNEYRAGVFNLTNAAAGDLDLRLRLTGLPGGGNPSWVKVYQVLTVGTRRFLAVSAALPKLPLVNGAYQVTVPAGMTRQIWLQFHPEHIAAGTYRGTVEITGSGQVKQVPLKLTIYPLRFPDRTTLCLGGWDYTNLPSNYGITPQNREQVIRYLQSHDVNAPWGTSSVFSGVKIGPDGKPVGKVDTTNFDKWVKTWPQAKIYLVYLAAGDNYDGAKMGTEAFRVRLAGWAHFWAGHMQKLGLKPQQLGVLIYDEPNRKSQYDLITAWAKVIKAAEPGLVTWEDPQPTEAKDCLEMFSTVDVLCPYRNPFLSRGKWYRQLFLNQEKEGRQLWFYNADGPARSFDPYSFYLLQEWQAFQVGAKGSCFWSFGDNGGVSCWNEYPAKGKGPYCPMYLDATSVTGAKYMEAIREGVEDYEYLTMLQHRVQELAQQGVAVVKLAPARELLRTACDRVLAGEKGADYRWDQKKDRTVQDTVRVEILQCLTNLAKL